MHRLLNYYPERKEKIKCFFKFSETSLWILQRLFIILLENRVGRCKFPDLYELQEPPWKKRKRIEKEEIYETIGCKL